VEYAFSTLKVVAIVVFILLGGWAVAGTGFANFTNHGGFLPHGAWGLWEPSGATQRAFRSTVARLVIFYLLTLAIIVAVVPWRESGKTISPFVLE